MSLPRSHGIVLISPMRAATQYLLCLVTAPDLKTARLLARVSLESRAAACANLVAGVESHYWWQGKLDRSREVLLLLKTTRARKSRLEKVILKHHPYKTPEIITLQLDAGTPRYLDWLSASVVDTRSVKQ